MFQLSVGYTDSFVWDSQELGWVLRADGLDALFCRRGNWGWAIESLPWARIRIKISWLQIQQSHRPSLGRINLHKAWGWITSFLRLHCMYPTTVVLTGLFTGFLPWENSFPYYTSLHGLPVHWSGYVFKSWLSCAAVSFLTHGSLLPVTLPHTHRGPTMATDPLSFLNQPSSFQKMTSRLLHQSVYSWLMVWSATQVLMDVRYRWMVRVS